MKERREPRYQSAGDTANAQFIAGIISVFPFTAILCPFTASSLIFHIPDAIMQMLAKVHPMQPNSPRTER